MDENVIDTLKIEIVGDSGEAVDSIGRLVSALEKINSVANSSNKGLISVQRNLDKIANIANKIDSKIYRTLSTELKRRKT